MNKKLIIISSVLMVLLASINVCFASSGLRTINKQNTVDYKIADEFYNSIPTTIIDDEIDYELQNVERKDNFKTLTKEQEIIEERITNTNNLEKVISLFNETKDFEEEGYTGTLTRDNSTLKVQIKDSCQEEYKVYLQKVYENVPSNELDNIPKEIEQNGTTYYLVNPVWDIAETEDVSNNEVPVKYNGIMYYEGVKTKTVVTSYLASIKYVGVLEKQVPDTTTFIIEYREIKKDNYIVPVAIAGSTGIIFFSGIIIYKKKKASVKGESKYKK